MNTIMQENEHKISHACYVKFQFVYGELKSAERKAADFCLSSPEFVSNATIGVTAKQVGCSEATLVRLAKRLGYQGYPELRENLLREDADEIASIIRINSDDSSQTITSNIVNATILSLRDSIASLDYKHLDSAITAISGARRILFATAGDANVVALAGVQKFARIGLPASYNADYDAQLIALSQMTHGDVLFCVSHSGRTKNVYNLAKVAKSRSVLVIALTSFPESPLAKSSDITLLTVSFTHDMMGEILTKRVPALCLMDVIYVCLMMRMSDSQRDNLATANKLLRTNKM